MTSQLPQPLFAQKRSLKDPLAPIIRLSLLVSSPRFEIIRSKPSPQNCSLKSPLAPIIRPTQPPSPLSPNARNKSKAVARGVLVEPPDISKADDDEIGMTTLSSPFDSDCLGTRKEYKERKLHSNAHRPSTSRSRPRFAFESCDFPDLFVDFTRAPSAGHAT